MPFVIQSAFQGRWPPAFWDNVVVVFVLFQAHFGHLQQEHTRTLPLGESSQQKIHDWNGTWICLVGDFLFFNGLYHGIHHHQIKGWANVFGTFSKHQTYANWSVWISILEYVGRWDLFSTSSWTNDPWVFLLKRYCMSHRPLNIESCIILMKL